MKLTPEDLAYMNDSHSYVPEHTRDTLVNYIEKGVPIGSFVYAILTNNLSEAFGRADHINSQHIKTIVSWIYNFAPSTCWGSPEKVEAWYKRFREVA